MHIMGVYLNKHVCDTLHLPREIHLQQSVFQFNDDEHVLFDKWNTSILEKDICKIVFFNKYDKRTE